jgi:hypothetical protein
VEQPCLSQVPDAWLSQLGLVNDDRINDEEMQMGAVVEAQQCGATSSEQHLWLGDLTWNATGGSSQQVWRGSETSSLD